MPRLQRKFDFQRPSGKNAASTLALSNPDIGPVSRPSARAAMMKYAPCSEPLRKATVALPAFYSSPWNNLIASGRCGKLFGRFS